MINCIFNVFAIKENVCLHYQTKSVKLIHSEAQRLAMLYCLIYYSNNNH